MQGSRKLSAEGSPYSQKTIEGKNFHAPRWAINDVRTWGVKGGERDRGDNEREAREKIQRGRIDRNLPKTPRPKTTKSNVAGRRPRQDTLSTGSRVERRQKEIEQRRGRGDKEVARYTVQEPCLWKGKKNPRGGKENPRGESRICTVQKKGSFSQALDNESNEMYFRTCTEKVEKNLLEKGDHLRGGRKGKEHKVRRKRKTSWGWMSRITEAEKRLRPYLLGLWGEGAQEKRLRGKEKKRVKGKHHAARNTKKKSSGSWSLPLHGK